MAKGNREAGPAPLKMSGGKPDIEARIRAILAKPYWDYEEVALVLNMDVKTLRNMKWRREVSYTRFGRKIYLPRQLILGELKANLVLCPASAAKKASRTA
jgi:hypothetical protein